MKKFISMLLVIAMVMSVGITSFAAEEEGFNIPEKVEIAFKVGDSTLMINSNPVTVETPYIAGAGTTLVPLRVITEAFGARVTWVGETKEIILEYPDVNITLQIDNTNAVVNDHTEALPVAPVLSPNGVTMVPLRFISETFGATVGFDNATGAITVVKENADEGNTISSSTDLPRIGDSYWNWSMMTPQGMMMTERFSDGSETYFEDGEDNKLNISVFERKEDLTFDEDFAKTKTSVSGSTCLKADRGKDEFGHDYMYFIFRNKEEVMGYYSVYVDQYCYDVVYYTKPNSPAMATLGAIVESFKIQFAANDEEKAQTHDLSNVDEDGYRLIENDDLKISFRIPATCLEMDRDVVNKITYVANSSTERTIVNVSVYSKTADVTAKILAQDDQKDSAKYNNKQFVTVSAVNPYTYNDLGENECYFWMNGRGLSGGDLDVYAIYFEKGDYVYTVEIQVKGGQKEIFTTIMESFKAEVLDKNEAGVMLYVSTEDHTPYTSKSGTWSMGIDTTWRVINKETSEGATYSHVSLPAVLQLTIADGSSMNYSQMMPFMLQFVQEYRSSGDEITLDVTKVNMSNAVFYKFQSKSTEDGESTIYVTHYVALMNGKLVYFMLLEGESIANAGVMEEVESFISTFTITRK